MGNIAQTAALLGIVYVSFFLLERALPLRRHKARLLPRLLVNTAISLTAFAAAALLVQPAASAMLGYTEGRGFGVIPLLGLHGAAKFVAAFLLLDLTFQLLKYCARSVTLSTMRVFALLTSLSRCKAEI